MSPNPSNTLIVIPARMGSTRLPGKPLADICGEPMIVHVWRRAVEAQCGVALVVAGEQSIVDAIRKAGGVAMVSDPHIPSGTDRVAVGLAQVDLEWHYDFIVNLQGDMPNVSPRAVSAALEPLLDDDVDIGTVAAPAHHDDWDNPSVVKVILDHTKRFAFDFERDCPVWPAKLVGHHIGIYAYRRAALERFVSLPQSQRERDRSLEQMRALDNGMFIGVAHVDEVPVSVDDEAGLELARAVMAKVAA